MMNPMDLSGKHILVAGASSGIGQGAAVYLSKLGARLSLVGRNASNLEKTHSMLEKNSHAIYAVDLSDTDAIVKLIRDAVNDNGLLDGVVYAAGTGETVSLKMLKKTVLERIFTVNYFAFIEMCRCVCKKGNFNAGMSIVGISSAGVFLGDKGKTAYCGTKAAMDASVRCIAKEVAEKGIRINTIQPGWIDTPLTQSYLQANGMAKEDLKLPDLGLGTVEDTGYAIAYLLSDNARFITSTSITVSGGFI